MRSCIWLAIASLGIAGCGEFSSVSPAKWQSCVTPDGVFSFKLPDEPTKQSEVRPLQGIGASDFTLFLKDEQNGGGYFVKARENGPISATEKQVRRMLRNRYPWPDVDRLDLTLNGYYGVEIHQEKAGAVWSARTYYVDGWTYEFAWNGRSKNDKNVKVFWDSISLVSPDQAGSITPHADSRFPDPLSPQE